MRRARRSSSRSFGRKRSVAWLPGFSGMDDAGGASARTMSFAGPVAGTAHTWSIASVLVVPAVDLPMHGGEDSVLERIRGYLSFSKGQRDAGAGFGNWSFSVRVVVAQHEALPAATFGEEFVTSVGLGQDQILWCGETICTADGGIDTTGFVDWDQIWRMDIDVRAKRKVQENSPIVLYFQTAAPAGTVALKMQVNGHLRTLMKRPR